MALHQSEKKKNYGKFAEGDVALSLSGCGFLGAYHFGVLLCLTRNAKSLIKRVKRYAGASAGSLVAALALLAPANLKEGLNEVYVLATEINRLRFGALTPGFLLNERLVRIADRLMPHDLSPANHHLYISLTNNDTKENRLVSEFRSREYLIQCLMASCYIPIYSMGFRAEPPVIDNAVSCYAFLRLISFVFI
ncbi:hypothetical protein AB6A40_005014 [Gnathostoma spinigerum]|uniref:PNPLA domain-containing protein n=1 Tax=Gnathostoma spinigerum TaxID=75299 RepID=A0ABD6EE62_9BILA